MKESNSRGKVNINNVWNSRDSYSNNVDRTAKLDIKDKIKELQIRKLHFTSRPRPFQNEQNLDDKHLNALCGGLQLLQRETSELWSEVSAYSLPDKSINL